MNSKEIETLRTLGCSVGPKPQRGTCALCRNRVPVDAMVFVLNQRICTNCGQKQIDLWNQKVKEG